MSARACLIVLGFVLLTTSATEAQTSRLSTYSWGAPATLPTLADSQQKASAVILFDNVEVDYVAPSSRTSNNYLMFRLFHRAVWVNDDKGIENFNKIGVPIREGVELVQLRARVISPRGNQRQFEKKDLKMMRNIAEGVDAQVLALEGVERGSIIEYYQVLRSPARVSDQEAVQVSEYDILSAMIRLTSERGYDFDARSLNGFPQFDRRVTGDRVEVTAVGKNIPAFAEEGFAFGAVNLQGAIWRVSVNGNEVTWRGIANQLASRLEHRTVRGSEFRRLLARAEALPELDDRVSLIDHVLKSSIQLRRDAPEQSFDQIARSNYANERDLTILYASLLKELNIRHHFVATTDRRRHVLQKDFPSYIGLNEFLIYLPDRGRFLNIDIPHHRYGTLPHYVAGNQALTFAPIEGSGGTTHYFSRIPLDDTASTYMDRRAEIDLQQISEGKASFTTRHILSGQRALELRGYIAQVPRERMVEFYEQYLSGGIEELEARMTDTSGTDAVATVSGKPLVISGTVSAAGLVERAGDDVLLHLGQVMGRQSELYEEVTRVQPIQLEFPNRYRYEISFTPPAGYTVVNAEDAMRRAYCPEGSDSTSARAGFESRLERRGERYVLVIREFYTDYNYPLGQYPAYRGVINAAADLQKVTLVLQKKK